MTHKENYKNRYSFAIHRKYCADNPRSVVLATGEDTLEFLQGQLTQDLSQLADSEGAYGFLLTAKGRVFGDAFLCRIDQERWQIVSWSLAAEQLMARLEAYIVADDVELSDETVRWRGWRVGGGSVAGELGLSGESELRELDPAPDLALGWRYLLGRADQTFEWPEGWGEGTTDAFEAVRIQQDWPSVPTDLGEGDFPQEGGRHLHAVSFTKGCYLGQEVMARLAATGRVRRALGRVRGSGPAPTGEVTLMQADKKVGALRSRINLPAPAGWLGLAMIQLAHFDPGKPLATDQGQALEFDGLVGG